RSAHSAHCSASELPAGPPVYSYRDESGDGAGFEAQGFDASAASGASVATAGQGSASKPSKTISAPTRFVLPNGLAVIVRENHANPTIAIQGLVKAGAMFDPKGKSGLASFVAGMLDQGTKTRTGQEQAAAIESLGASLRFDGGPETASVSGNLLSSDLDTVLGAMADALRNPIFPADQVEKVRGEMIIDCRVAENSTASVAARRANELLYPLDHPYHFSSSGSESTVNGITRDDLVAFHAANYGPNQMILVLVGDVTPAQARTLIEKAFGSWKALPNPPAFKIPVSAPPAAVARLVARMPGKSQADVAWAVPGIARTAPDYDATMLMNYLLGGGSLSSRLMDSLRDQQGLVYGVYSSMLSGIGAGPIQIRAGTNPENVDRTVSAMLEQVKRFHDSGPTDEEMDEAKGYLTGVFPVRLETNAGVAGQLLSAEIYGLGLDYIERYPSLVRAITSAGVAAAARKYLNPDVYVLVIAGSYEDAGKGAPGGK
ncbi:MAG: M16 family metallopeptidase, partial [Candidatus Eiseniibacteriota bacterium]